MAGKVLLNSKNKKNKMYKTLSILMVALFFSCNNNTNSVLDTQTNYYFEKEYIITGKLSEQYFYGAPNFGDTPDIDELEHCYLITIDSNINIMAASSVNTYNTENKYAQSCFQIVGSFTMINGNRLSLYEYFKKIPIGTVISLKGTFDSAMTGHHHTKVLFVVNEDFIPNK